MIRCPQCGYYINPRREQEQSNLLHKLIRSYSLALGYDYDWAKCELKYKYGVWEPVPMDLTEWKPPTYQGQFFEMYEGTPHHSIVYMKSESAYTKDEESHLVDMTVIRCREVGADIEWMEG